MNKEILTKKLERFNKLIQEDIYKNTKELNQLILDILNSDEDLVFKLHQKCDLCSSFNLNEYYVNLDECKHCLDFSCFINPFLKPSHYRLKEDIISKMINVKCPVGNCRSLINIHKLLNKEEFKRRLIEKRNEYEDENSFYCHVMLEKVDNEYKLELPCGGIINRETFLYDLFIKLSNFEEIKCHLCNQKIDLDLIKQDILIGQDDKRKKDFLKIYDKYYEKEVLLTVNKGNSDYTYCPFPNCNQFISFECGNTHHQIRYCDYCCEPLCLQCKQPSKECNYYQEIMKGKTLHKKCLINHHTLDDYTDEFKSKFCDKCNLIICGKCKMPFEKISFEDHFM